MSRSISAALFLGYLTLIISSGSGILLVGCAGPKEVEYPPEVIPDIPPSNRTDASDPALPPPQ
jgi:hypothetical protein